MSRKARSALLYDGCYSHIISRSIRKLKVYRTSEDFRLFLKIINEFKSPSSFNRERDSPQKGDSRERTRSLRRDRLESEESGDTYLLS